MDGQRIDLHRQTGLRRVKRWRRGHADDPACLTVEVGTLADGRWWASCTGRATARTGRAEGWLADDEMHAYELAVGWMCGPGWVEVPLVPAQRATRRRQRGWTRVPLPGL